MINKIYIPGKLALKIDGTRYFKPDDKEVLQQYLEEIMNGDPEVEVEITIVRDAEKKTTQQLRYFYGIVLPIVKQALEDLQGEPLSKGEAITFLKTKFFFEEVESGNKFVKLPMSFARATQLEIRKFIQDVIEFSRDILDVTIPEP